MDLFFYIFAALFSVLNPIGAIPVFVGLTTGYTREELSKTSLWTAINVFIILIVAYFMGEYVLRFFGISLEALRIAGGLIIANSGFGLLSGQVKKRKGINKKVETEAQQKHAIALTPLAMPLLAGPGSISLLIAFYQEHNNWIAMSIAIGAILAVAVSIYFVLRSANYLVKYLGESGIVAISRIVGFFVIAIGIQYIVNALIKIIQANF
ncbi:MarC family NAAT transporter [Flavobacterium amniphilum]|uniref:MarC family NAAT transporter n=1 Tax=Flavobacterium amniphilum TaxID=1834035 RepID=UPI002029E78F|nr:MarC family NAAT transporter [Flavobacterium amniphilum]MCL9805148.1 MarC family NAAT transporter [Flavobacterium amniphilum]